MVTGSDTMRSTSARLSLNIEAVSTTIGENATAATEAGSMTVRVRDSLSGVTTQSQSQSAAAADVSTSVLALAARVLQMDATAQQVSEHAATLYGIVEQFRLESGPVNTQPPGPAARRDPGEWEADR
jgi:methyl-accepting chemotaxis protein